MPGILERARAKLRRPEIDPDDVRMTLGEHLEELRSRMIKLLIGLLVGAVVCFVFRDQLMKLLLGPTFAVLRAEGFENELVALDPLEPFMTSLKVSIIIGFILSAPYGLYQIWAFVACGLYRNERRYVQRFVPVSIVLFMTGALFFLFVVLPVLLSFLINFMEKVPSLDPNSFAGMWVNRVARREVALPPTTRTATLPNVPVWSEDPPSPPDGSYWYNATAREVRMRIGNETLALPVRPANRPNTIRPNWSMSNTLQMTLQMAAAFGVGFQVPVVVAFLATLGIFSARQMGRSRRVTWFVMAIGAAVFTPSGDPGTMLLLLIPMALLFEAGLLAARMIEKRKAAGRAG